MKFKQHFILLLLILVNRYSYGQMLVKGTVYAIDAKETLPGTLVEELGTTNHTVTDQAGKFEIQVADSNALLIFSFVGMENDTLGVAEQSQLQLQMHPALELPITNIISCFFVYSYSEIGIASGVNYTPLGLKLHNLTSFLWGMKLNLESTISFRKLQQNHYLDIYLDRYDLFNKGIGFIGEYRNFRIQNDLVQEFTLAPSYFWKGMSWTVGYARQYRQTDEISSQAIGALYISLEKNLPKGFKLSMDSHYFEDNWQFDIDLYKHFLYSQLSVSVGYEKLYLYDEFDLSVAYRLEY